MPTEAETLQNLGDMIPPSDDPDEAGDEALDIPTGIAKVGHAQRLHLQTLQTSIAYSPHPYTA
jgi:hypothetical protein